MTVSDIAQLEQQILAEVAAAADEAAVEAVRVAALGKSGTVSALLRTPKIWTSTSANAGW